MPVDNPFANAEVGEESRDLNAAKGWHPPIEVTKRDRGEGSFKRLVLRWATVIDGTGARR